MAATGTGKAIAARNSIRHGVLAGKTPVVPSVEREADWQEHLDGITDAYKPVGQLEAVLTERVALLLWRIGRVARYERGWLAAAQETLLDTHRSTLLSAAHASQRLDHPANASGNVSYTKRTVEVLNKVTGVLDASTRTSLDAEEVVTVLYTLASVVGTKGFDLDEFSLPGVPDDVSLEEFDGWTVGLFTQAIDTIAAFDHRTRGDLLRQAHDHAEAEARIAKVVGANMQTAVERLRRRYLLPDEDTLDKVVRYEAHLSRQLYATMHELEALQAKRAGQPTPLARVEVSGLPET